MTRLLVVEDEAIAALFLRHTLERLGHQIVAVVDSGEEAVEVALRERPDLVLMDIRLRGDLDGVDAANRIRAEGGIRSLFISAYAEAEIKQRYRYPGEFLLISKPVMEYELVDALRGLGIDGAAP
jgi:CheY-like chemotaxis protein